MIRNKTVCFLLLLAAITAANAQGGPPTQAVPTSPPASSLAPGGVGDIQSLLTRLEQTAQDANRDIASLRIQKWKADGANKNEAEQNAESVRRNLNDALPGMIAQVRSAPDDLTASFKLYRNLSALYDVMASLTELAGAFGPKGEYQALVSDVSTIDNVRHVLGDRVETLASIKEGEIVRLRNLMKAAQSTSKSEPATKKVIVDDQEPAKKPVRKKKKSTTPASGSTTAPPPQPQR